MNHVDLFSGIGGFALASSWVWGEEYVPLAHSEVEKFPCQVYHKHFPESECLGDITKIDWARFKGRVDLVTGGFPCQPHSLSGKRKASKDERDLWGECIRSVCEIRPRYALFENVPGLLTSERGRFFNRVLSDLAKAGYDAEWSIVSALSIGAPHLRERLWVLAYPSQNDDGRFNPKRRGLFKPGNSDWTLDWSNPKILTESAILRKDDGLSTKLDEDRNSSLGNSIVPQCAEVILRAIKEINGPNR